MTDVCFTDRMDWPLLAPLADDERANVLQAAPRRRYGKGEIIVREGDLAESLHLVSTGRLAVRVTTRTGETATLNILSPGDHFGEISLVQRSQAVRRSATIIALEPAETLVITFETFRSLTARFPRLEAMLVESLATRVERLTESLVEALYETLDQRLYRSLSRLADVYGTNGDSAGQVVIPLTQEQLADLVGGTRPSVNQTLGRLAQQGIVRAERGRLIVVDAQALRRKAHR